MLCKYRNFPVLPKLPGLVIKCLQKIIKIVNKHIGTLDIDKVLLAIHEYLLVIDHNEKSEIDDLGIKITKTVIFELVKI